MTKRMGGILTLLLVMIGMSTRGANTTASLLLPVETARAGETFLAGIRLEMKGSWHTYWRNPGLAGLPTTVDWDLPENIIAGEIQWPVPEKYLPAGSTNWMDTTYVYHHEVVLLVPLTISSNAQPGQLELKAQVAWLECEVACLPGDQEVSARLTVADQSRPSADAATIAEWQSKLPQTLNDLSATARWTAPAEDDTRSLTIEWAAEGGAAPDFYPYSSDDWEVGPLTQVLASDPGTLAIGKTVTKYDGDWPSRISGLLVWEVAGEKVAVSAELALANSEKSAPPPSTPVVGSQAGSAQSLWKMLLYALIGGMILNIMPCVLPVISLKILGFVNEADSNPKRVRFLGMAYTAGVLASFLALAALVIGLKVAGRHAGWGMQFSNPQFLILLTILVTLIALNLFGLFEVTLSGKVMSAAGAVTTQQGAAGAFFNGVLATVLATPCTAPILGTALGFAFAQPALLIVVFFLTVGFGLTLPYILLSWNPAWLRFLPKPGVWMERFKVAMGFPMLATAVWLFHLLPTFYGKRVLWMGLFLVVLALAAWIFGTFVQRGSKRRGLAAVLSLVLLVGGFVYGVEGKLQWRNPIEETSAAGSLPGDAEGSIWQPWSREAVTAAREAGHPVLVDFTAEWCLTCNINVKPVLESKTVQMKLKEIGAVALLADNTRFPPVILEELARFGRAGVPLVLVYPPDISKPPIVLPEAITTGIVLTALEEVSR